jgi:transcription elongation factor GreA
MNRAPMTVRGAERLREELQHLKAVARPRVIKAIAEARAHGDLRENAEYHAAREEQGFIEGRIADIEAKLANAQIIDVTQVNAGGRVVFGATVELLNLESEEEMRYQIVGEDEADIKGGLLSNTAPMARALIGKVEGDVVSVQTPAGLKEYEIVRVLYV